jgi:hypothetical protein
MNYKHSEQARAQHTNGPRDVSRCGALSLLQKPLHYRGGESEELVLNPFVVVFGPVFASAYASRGCPRRTCRPGPLVKHADAVEVRIAAAAVLAATADAVLVAHRLPKLGANWLPNGLLKK